MENRAESERGTLTRESVAVRFDGDDAVGDSMSIQMFLSDQAIQLDPPNQEKSNGDVKHKWTRRCGGLPAFLKKKLSFPLAFYRTFIIRKRVC